MTASRAVSPTRDTESGNMIELREHPESRHYQVTVETHVMAEVMTLGMVKTCLDWTIRSQAPKPVTGMEKVQRLSGHGRARKHA